MRWTSAVLVVAIGILQVVIASRAATLLFFVGLLAQLMAQHLKRNLGLIFVTVAGTAFLLSTPIGDRFISRFSELKDLGSIVIRIWFFQEAWRRLVDHLPWGIGLGQGATFPDKLQNNDPHNYWLVIGPELGVIGLILWVVVLFVLWRQIRAVSRTPGWTGIGLALQVSFWLSQLHTVVEPTFQGVQYQFVYFWLFAGYLGYHRHERDQGRGPAASISR
jgi:O-antigen ligase